MVRVPRCLPDRRPERYYRREKFRTGKKRQKQREWKRQRASAWSGTEREGSREMPSRYYAIIYACEDFLSRQKTQGKSDEWGSKFSHLPSRPPGLPAALATLARGGTAETWRIVNGAKCDVSFSSNAAISRKDVGGHQLLGISSSLIRQPANVYTGHTLAPLPPPPISVLRVRAFFRARNSACWIELRKTCGNVRAFRSKARF